MTKLQVFSSGLFSAVRATMIEDEPWFVGADVAKALDYASTANAIHDNVDSEDKQFVNGSDFTLANDDSNAPISNRELTIINESGVYSLIFGSKQERAREFKRWVTHEVLPTLRKTGSYSVKGSSAPGSPSKMDYFRAAKLLATCKPERLPYVTEMIKKTGVEISDETTYGLIHAQMVGKTLKPVLPSYFRRDSGPKSYKKFLLTDDEVALKLREAYEKDVSFHELVIRTGVDKPNLYRYMWGERCCRSPSARQNIIDTVNELVSMVEEYNAQKESVAVM